MVGPARCPPGADKPLPTGRRRAWASTAFYHGDDGCAIASRANAFIFCRSTKPACFLLAVERSPPQLSLPSLAFAQRGQARTLCLAFGPSWHSCRVDDETCHFRPTPLLPAPSAAAHHGQQAQRSLRGGRRNQPASFWRWNGANQAREPPPRPAPKPDAPSGGLAGHARHNFRGQVTPRPNAARPEYETTSPSHRAPHGQPARSEKLTTGVRGGRRFRPSPADQTTARPRDQLTKTAGGSPSTCTPLLACRGWKNNGGGQHDARPALTSRSQRAGVGPGPPRHSTTLPTEAQSPAGPALSFFAGLRNRLASFLRWNGASKAREPPSRPEPKAG